MFFFNCTKKDIKEDQEDIIDIFVICCFSHLSEIIIYKYKKNLDMNYEILFVIISAYYIYYSTCKDIWTKDISNSLLLNKTLNIDFDNVKCKITGKNHLYEIDDLHDNLNKNKKSRGVYTNNKNIQIIKIELINYDEENPFDLHKLSEVNEKINNDIKEYRSKYDLFFNTSFEIEYEIHLQGFFKNYHELKNYFESFTILFVKHSNITNKDLIYLTYDGLIIDDSGKFKPKIKFFRKIKIEDSFNLSSNLISKNGNIFHNTNQVDIINCNLSDFKYNNYEWNLSLVNVNI
jgi:hypothetical protein